MFQYTKFQVDIPPGVEDAVWHSWVEYWLAWKDIYINLSWVHKHRAVCKPDFVEWYDSYVKEYPWILQEIADEFSATDEVVNENNVGITSSALESCNESKRKPIPHTDEGCSYGADQWPTSGDDDLTPSTDEGFTSGVDEGLTPSVDEDLTLDAKESITINESTTGLATGWNTLLADTSVETDSTLTLDERLDKTHWGSSGTSSLGDCTTVNELNSMEYEKIVDSYVRNVKYDEDLKSDEVVCETHLSHDIEDRGGGESDEKISLDEAFEKHSHDRYYIHLYQFLSNSGVEMNSEMNNFFAEKVGQYSIVKSNEREGSEISCSNINYTESIEMNNDKNVCEKKFVGLHREQDEKIDGMSIEQLTEYNNSVSQDDDSYSKDDSQIVVTASCEEEVAENMCDNYTNSTLITHDEEPQTSSQKYANHGQVTSSAIVADNIDHLDADIGSQFPDNKCAQLDSNICAPRPSTARQRKKNKDQKTRFDAGIGWALSTVKKRKLNEAEEQDTRIPNASEACCDKKDLETLTTEINTTRISESTAEEHIKSKAIKALKFFTQAAWDHILTLLLMPTAGIYQTLHSLPFQFFTPQMDKKQVADVDVSFGKLDTKEERQSLRSIRKEKEEVDWEKQLYDWLSSCPSLSDSISQQITCRSHCSLGPLLKKVFPERFSQSFENYYYKLKSEMQDGLCLHDLEFLDLQNEVGRNGARKVWREMTEGYRQLRYLGEEKPCHLPEELHKYWAQRHRFFVKFDEGIRLDNESWFSVTPEVIALHQASRCQSDVVVDAFCGAGGNAIQLARVCSQVIAIDIDPIKIALARHNAEIYKVSHKIQFLIGNFFQLAPSLKADAVLLSPPWGGVDYHGNQIYNVINLDGNMKCNQLMEAARTITSNIALYLPRNSNIMQILQLAEPGDCIDIENSFMGRKKKALTVYFGALGNI